MEPRYIPKTTENLINIFDDLNMHILLQKTLDDLREVSPQKK